GPRPGGAAGARDEPGGCDVARRYGVRILWSYRGPFGTGRASHHGESRWGRRPGGGSTRGMTGSGPVCPRSGSGSSEDQGLRLSSQPHESTPASTPAECPSGTNLGCPGVVRDSASAATTTDAAVQVVRSSGHRFSSVYTRPVQ